MKHEFVMWNRDDTKLMILKVCGDETAAKNKQILPCYCFP
jgi:hypothetical protein